MSGPKMIGITCDPEVIARNNERLRRIGKEKYYGDVFSGINTDISNTVKWVDTYGISAMSSVPDDFIDEKNLINQIKQLKVEHMQKIESEKINLRVIASNEPSELNNIGVEKVKGIPKWKKEFIDQISILLKLLQEEIDKEKEKENQSIAENEMIAQKISEEFNEISKKAHALDGQEINKSGIDIQRYEGDIRQIKIDLPPKKRDPLTLPFSLDELALIDMFKNDIFDFSNLEYTDDEEKEIIERMKKKLLFIEKPADTDNEMRNKRITLNEMRLDYVRLETLLSYTVAKRNAEEQERSVLVIDYISFVDALACEKEDVSSWSIDELKQKVDGLRKKVEKQEERIYIEETIEEVLEEYGYSSITSEYLHEADTTSRIIFENGEGAKISTSIGSEMIMMNVVGEGESVPTDAEVKEQVKQQEAFCSLYPQIREKLKKKGIRIDSETLMPVAKEYAMNVDIKRQKDIHKSTKKFSFRHVPLVSEQEETDMSYETVKKSMYAPMEE